MSNVVLVSAGQCGNQLGYNLLSNIYSELSSSDNELLDIDTFFRDYKSSAKKRARCVCLDTEPKAGSYFHIIQYRVDCRLIMIQYFNH